MVVVKQIKLKPPNMGLKYKRILQLEQESLKVFIQTFPCAVKVNLQFYFKMQALAKIKKLLRLQIVKY